MFDVRLIIDPPLPGPRNMAVDEALLMDAIKNGVATLRLYQWSEPTLSLGYFQRFADRVAHIASKNCTVVRRQSGGGAILHDRELTYSLTLPPNCPLARQSQRLYDSVHQTFIAALSRTPSADVKDLGLRLRGDRPESIDPVEPFLCFQRQSPGDVILVGPDPGNPFGAKNQHVWKVLGSAQRRHRGAILQHGSLLIEKSIAAPELPGIADLSGCEFHLKSLISAVCQCLSNTLELRLIPIQLSAELESKAVELTNTKYGSPTWTKRR